MSDNEVKARPRIIPAQPAAEKAAGRPPLRETSRELAAKRAAELRTQRSHAPIGTDEYDVSWMDGDGWTHQWHTWSIYEQRQVSNMMSSDARGWEPVPREEYPEMMPKDSTEESIMRKGMILMRIPTEILEEYRREEAKAARDLIRGKEAQLAGTPEGTLSRSEDARTRPRINRSYESGPIPE